LAQFNDKAIRARFFGDVSLSHSGGVVREFRSHRVPALLAFLVWQPRPHLREQLAYQLWPESDAGRGRHNLRQTLLYLREALGPVADELLTVSRSHIALNPGALSSDAEILMSADLPHSSGERQELLEQVIQAYRGPFLPGIDDEWVTDARRFFTRIYVQSLTALADAEMEAHPARALALATKAVAEEPLMNSPRASKIRALVATSESASAQLEYEAFAELLDQELGEVPADFVREALDGKRGVVETKGFQDKPVASRELETAIDLLRQGNRPQLAVNLVISMTPYWIAAGTPGFGLSKLEETMRDAAGRLSEAVEMMALTCRAELTDARGDTVLARAQIREIRTRWKELTNEVAVRLCLLECGIDLGELDGKAAFAAATDAVELTKDSADLSLRLDALTVATAAALCDQQFEQGLAWADTCLVLAQQIGDRLLTSIAYLRKAEVLEELERPVESEICGREALQLLQGIHSPRASNYRMAVARLLENFELLDEAEEGYRQVIQDFRGFESKFSEAMALTYLGDLTQARGRPHEAVALHRKALEIRRERNQYLGVATSLRGLGKAQADLRELESSRESLMESAHHFSNEDALPGYAGVLLSLAGVEARRGEMARALRLAKRARKLLGAMSLSDRKSIGRSGVTAVGEADALIANLMTI